MTIITFMISTISILLTTAFITLMERKLLSFIQLRKGPNKVGPWGILQPFSDAMKLMHKYNIKLTLANKIMYMTAPFTLLMITIMLTTSMSMSSFNPYDQNFNLLSFMLISSIMIYPIMMVGWSPNSKYSSLGSFRNMAQIISYEITMFLIILTPLMIYLSFSISLFKNMNIMMKVIIIIMPITLMWMITILSETNRSPFDFAEGESELVSGFNVEYMSIPFTLIFLAEYTALTIMAMITTMIFIPTNYMNVTITLILVIIMLNMRGMLPRHRFDMMMMMNWKTILPLSISPPLIMFILNIMA